MFKKKFHAAGLLAACSMAWANCAQDAYRLTRPDSIIAIKSGVAYPHIPTARQMSLSHLPAQNIHVEPRLSAGLSDPLLEEIRKRSLVPDFKPLSDLELKPHNPGQLQTLVTNFQKTPPHQQNAKLLQWLKTHYQEIPYLTDASIDTGTPQRIESKHPALDACFEAIDRAWPQLFKKTPPTSRGSSLPSPYPVIVAAPERFKESYYWDTYFAIKGLLSTQRVELAAMQVDNFLESIRQYGHVPNGGRDYYLSRSQPPFISSMVHEVYLAMKKNASPKEKERLLQWLRLRAYPLVRADYEKFWMNPNTRYNTIFQLNHPWDSENAPRPERSALDKESELGRTFRDVRAAAETGNDFTAAHQNEASQILDVLLNSMLFKTETDLTWMAEETGDKTGMERYHEASIRRQNAMHRWLWNPKRGEYDNFNLRTHQPVPLLTANTFAPLFVGAATADKARIVKDRLKILERPGGIAATETIPSPHQWDADNVWAPQMVMAAQGLLNYGYSADAQRISLGWLTMIADEFQRSGKIYERMNGATRLRPIDNNLQYPVQGGAFFAWTQGAFQWLSKEIMGFPSHGPQH